MSIYNELNTENYGSSITESGCFCKKDQPCGYESERYDDKNWCYTTPGCSKTWDHCEKPSTDKGYKCKDGDICNRPYQGGYYCDTEEGSAETWDYCTPPYSGELKDATQSNTAQPHCPPGYFPRLEEYVQSVRDPNSDTYSFIQQRTFDESCVQIEQTCEPGTYLKHGVFFSRFNRYPMGYDETLINGVNTKDFTELNECLSCPDGTYKADVGHGTNPYFNEEVIVFQFQCTPKTKSCPSSQIISKKDNTQDDVCVDKISSCDPGQRIDEATNACVECPSGTFSLGGNVSECTKYTEEACPTGQVRTSPMQSTSDGNACTSFATSSYKNLGNQNHCTYQDGGGSPWCYTSDGFKYCDEDKTQDLPCVDCNATPENSAYTAGCEWACNEGFVRKDDSCNAVVDSCESGKFLEDNECKECPSGTFSLGGNVSECTKYTEEACPTGKVRSSPTTSTSNGDSCTSYTKKDNKYKVLGNQSHCTYRDGGGSPWCYKENGSYGTCNEDKTQDLPCIDCNNLPENAEFTGTDCSWECLEGYEKQDNQCVLLACDSGFGLKDQKCTECTGNTYSPGGEEVTCQDKITSCDTGFTFVQTDNTKNNTCDPCDALENSSFTNGCDFECNAGFILKTRDEKEVCEEIVESCSLGKKLDDNQCKACDVALLPNASWIVDKVCEFSCDGGFVSKTRDGNKVCEEIVESCPAGKKLDDNQCKACDVALLPNASWIVDKVCEFSCDDGFVLKTRGGEQVCEPIVSSCSTGQKLEDNQCKSCGDLPTHASWTGNGCDFDCVQNCDTTRTVKYLEWLGVRKRKPSSYQQSETFIPRQETMRLANTRTCQNYVKQGNSCQPSCPRGFGYENGECLDCAAKNIYLERNKDIYRFYNDENGGTSTCKPQGRDCPLQYKTNNNEIPTDVSPYENVICYRDYEKTAKCVEWTWYNTKFPKWCCPGVFQGDADCTNLPSINTCKNDTSYLNPNRHGQTITGQFGYYNCPKPNDSRPDRSAGNICSAASHHTGTGFRCTDGKDGNVLDYSAVDFTQDSIWGNLVHVDPFNLHDKDLMYYQNDVRGTWKGARELKIHNDIDSLLTEIKENERSMRKNVLRDVMWQNYESSWKCDKFGIDRPYKGRYSWEDNCPQMDGSSTSDIRRHYGSNINKPHIKYTETSGYNPGRYNEASLFEPNQGGHEESHYTKDDQGHFSYKITPSGQKVVTRYR
jgi:hypothetical protein